MKILLINGWGGLLDALYPLQHELQQRGHHVDIMDYVDVLDPKILNQYVEKLSPYDVVAGWSLGGQVATVLLDEYYQKYPNAPKKILWTLFSNPCFIVNKNWKYAQMEHEFLDFEHHFIEQPKRTLHIFLRNISGYGGAEYQKLVQMQNDYLHQDGAYQHLLMGLNLLKQLNTLACLARLDNHHIRHFCFLAEQDDLAPHKLYEPLMQFGSSLFLTLEWMDFKHHFSIYTQAKDVSAWFQSCLEDELIVT